jgi:hypothetical protein
VQEVLAWYAENARDLPWRRCSLGRVGLDRPGIERTDFPAARRGYDREAVDRHLAGIADEVERLARDRDRSPDGLAGVAGEQVRAIVEAAERAGAELRERAATESREHVARASRAAGELVVRIEQLERELVAVLEGARGGAERVQAGLRALEADVARVGGPPAAPAAPVVTPPPAPAETALPDDAEGARLVALDMALSGSPRVEVDAYLAERYALEDRDALLDEVFATVGA